MSSNNVQYNGKPLNEYLKKLDAQDSKADGKIEASVWNDFAEGVGAIGLRQGDSMSLFQAESEATPLIQGDTPELQRKQALVRKAASTFSNSGYSVSGEMMRISLTPGALKIGNHAKDGYSVVSPDKAEQKLASLGLKEGMNGHMEKEAMRLKMVEFKPDSDVSKGMSCSGVVKDAIQNWYSHGAKDTEPIAMNTFDKKNWKSADDADTAFGVGYSYLVGLKDNGDGTVTGYVEDVYDFSPNYYGSSGGIIDKMTGEMLEHVCELQDAGKIQQYRTLTPVTVKIASSKGGKKAPVKQSWSQQAKDKVKPLVTKKQRESLSGVASVGSAVVDGAETAVDTVSDAGKYVAKKGKQAWKAIKNLF